ncbi:MAG: hypothetical protein HFH41_04790 [Lachnospiraceae bacterium]|nr:hypothetical protein [Lachnospiraceae bacterium]
MLRKLLKYEWKATGKVLCLVNLALVLITLVGCCILSTDIFDNEDALPLALLLITLYTLSLAAIGIITLIYLFLRFYRNLFTAEGYLMHTLPVTPGQLFHSKLIVGYFWVCLNSILGIASATLLSFAAAYHFVSTHGIEIADQFILEMGMTDPSSAQDWSVWFQEFFYYPPLQFLLMILILQLVCNFSSLLTGYMSILLGQLVEKYKQAASFGFYILFYVANQIVSSAIILIPCMRTLLATDHFMKEYARLLIPLAIVSQIIIGIIFYTASLLLMRKKVNLD